MSRSDFVSILDSMQKRRNMDYLDYLHILSLSSLKFVTSPSEKFCNHYCRRYGVLSE